MSLRSSVLLFVTLSLMGVLSACGLIIDESRIKVAQIGGEAITRGDLDMHIQQLSVDQRYKSKSRQAKLDILNQIIDKRLLLKEADKRGVTATDKEIDAEMERRGIADASQMPSDIGQAYPSAGGAHQHQELDARAMREQVKKDIRIAKVQRLAIPPGLTVSNKEIEKYYEENKQLFLQPERVRIRFVTRSTMEDAQQILERARGGEDFAAIVRKIAAETQGKGGLEWPPEFYMPLQRMRPPALRKAVSAAKPGDIIGPIKRAQGYDVVQLIDRKAPATAPLAPIRNAVKQRLLLTKAQQAYEQFLKDLKKSYQVKVFPESLPAETSS